MNKFIKILGIALALSLSLYSVTYAGVLTPSGRGNGGILTPSLWTLSGLSLVPWNSSYIIGSSLFDAVFRSVTITSSTVMNSVLVSGSFARNTTSTATSTTLTTSNYFVAVDAATSSVNITLPSATSSAGSEFTIKKIDVTTSTVFVLTSTSSQTIDGVASSTISSQWSSVSVISNGSNWLKK